MTEQDYRRLFDRVSPGSELVERTIKAAEGGGRTRHRPPLRRLAALAACVGLLLGLVNHQALAVGVERVFRYFSGIGATAEDGDALWLLEEPVTWAEGGSCYQVEAFRSGGYLFVHMTHLSDRPVEELPEKTFWLLELYAGETPLTQGFLNFAGTWLPQETFRGTGGTWTSSLNSRWQEAGYRSEVPASAVYEAAEQPPEGYLLRVCREDGTLVWETNLKLTPAQEITAVSETRDFPEGRVTALVSTDGRRVSVYPDRTVGEDGRIFFSASPYSAVTFIGASGQRYHDDPDTSRNMMLGAFSLQESVLPEDVTEPIVAVEIDGLLLDTIDGQGRGSIQHRIVTDLNWVIECP